MALFSLGANEADHTGDPDPTTVHLGSATGLDGPGSRNESVDHDVGNLLSYQSTAYQCDEWSSEGTTTNPNTGETYEQVRCTSQSTTTGTYTNQTGTVHEIYTAGDADLDPPPEYDGNWYVDGVTEIAESYDPGLIRNGTFDLGRNEAIFVVGNGNGNFSVLYYRANDGKDDYYTDGVGPTGMATTSNTYVVNVGGTEIVVCDDGDTAEECDS